MISREEAIETLSFLESNEILSEDLQGKLLDIRSCIEAELQGWHFWGAEDDDYIELHIARRSDLWTDEVKKKCEELDHKHTFTPAPYEVDKVSRELEDDEEDAQEAAGVYV